MKLNDYFYNFASLSSAASGNQTFFTGAEGHMESVVFYRFSTEVNCPVSLLFSDNIDSTFEDGSHSRAGDTLGGWKLLFAAISVTEKPDPHVTVKERPLSFEGKGWKAVQKGEWFASDPLEVQGKKGDYLRLHLIFEGGKIPCLKETLLDSYRMVDGKWVFSADTPLASMIGGARKVKAKIAFLGDSITEGIGTQPGSYEGFVPQIASMLGEEYAVWNLGIGYARAADAARNGSFLLKATSCDGVVLCLGTNDLLQTGDPKQLIENLRSVVSLLDSAGKRLLVQALPPFDYEGEAIEKWKSVNRFIREELGRKFPVFDPVPFLSPDKEHPYIAVYGGHPNAEGCRKWADRLYEKMRHWILTF